MPSSWFNHIAKAVSRFTGGALCFSLGLGAVVLWAALGPIFHYSDTWQMIINTSTTIITFLMVFLIQNSQNRDTEAIQIKLNELIRATEGAHNTMLGAEELDPKELARLRSKYTHLAERARDPEDASVTPSGIEHVVLDEPQGADKGADNPLPLSA